MVGLFVYIILLCFVSTSDERPGELNCENGKHDYTESSSCICEDNWSGINCQMCSSDESCIGQGYEPYCDNSLIIGSLKRYECDIYNSGGYENMIGDKMLIYCGNDTCELEMWGEQKILEEEIKYHKVFGCTLFNISGEYDDVTEVLTVHSSRSKCECTEGSVYCDHFVVDIVNKMVDESRIECDVNTDLCEVIHSNFLGVIPLTCRGAGCLSNHLPDIGNYTTKTILLVIGWQGVLIDLMCVFLILVVILLAIQLCLNDLLHECFIKEVLYKRFKKLGNEYKLDFSIDAYLVKNYNYSFINWLFCKMCCNCYLGFIPTSKNIEVEIKAKGKHRAGYKDKYIPKIKNLTYLIRPGTTCVLGPAGTGKTIWANLIKNHKMSGKRKRFNIVCNEHDVKKYPYNLISSMSEQQESPSSFLTVDEEIEFSCSLRNPFHKSKDKVKWSIFKADVYDKCGITGLKYMLIGDQFKSILSGGQRKKVEFAREILSESMVLIMDEPFRGVDSEAILNMLKLVTKYRNKTTGYITIITMHSPPERAYDVFERILFFTSDCDLHIVGTVDGIRRRLYKVLESKKQQNAILSEGTETEEDGDDDDDNDMTGQSKTFERSSIRNVPGYERTSISENIFKYYKELPKHSDKLPRRGYGSKLGEEDPACMVYTNNRKTKTVRVIPNSYRSKGVEVYYLLKREFYKSIIRYKLIVFLQLLITVVASVFIGVLYNTQDREISGNQNRMGVIYWLCSYFSLISIGSIWLFEEDKLTYARELASGYYSKGSLYVAKVIFKLIITSIPHPLILSVVNYWIIGLKEDRFFYFIVILIYVSVLSELQSTIIGIISGWVTTSKSFSKTIGVMLFTCSLLFNSLTSGLLLNRLTLSSWVNVLGYFSFWKAAYEALMINEFVGTAISLQLVDDEPPAIVPGEYWLERIGMRKESFESNLAILVSSVIIFFLIGYFLFKRLYYVKK